MSESIQPEIQDLLEEVLLFLGQLGDPSISKSLRAKADNLKQKIEKICFESIEESPVDEELYDEAGREEDDAVPELPKARDGVKSSPSTLTSTKDEHLITDVAVTDLSNATKQGYIEKKKPDTNRFANLFGQYQKRYCVIHEGIFYYFEAATSRRQNGAFHLKDYEVRPAYHLVKSVTRKEGSFELVSPGQRCFQFLAKDFEEMKEWISAIYEWSDIKIPPVSALTKPADAVDKSSGMSPGGSDSGSINTTSGADVTDDQADYVDTDLAPNLKRVSPRPMGSRKQPMPIQHEIYDDAEPDQEMYDEATVGSPAPVGDQETYDEASAGPALHMPAVAEEIYDEAGIEEELYDEAGEAPPLTKPLPKIPPAMGKRTMPQPPVPDSRPLPPPPPALTQKTIQTNSEDYSNMFYGLWDCDTSISHELPFSSGDIIQVVDREHESSGWWTGLINGKVGLVPKSFLTAAYAKCN